MTLTVERTPDREERIADWLDGERQAITEAFGEEYWPAINEWIDALPWIADVDLAVGAAVEVGLCNRQLEPHESARYTAARRTLVSLSEHEMTVAIAYRMGVRHEEAERMISAATRLLTQDADAGTDDGSPVALYRHFDARDRLLYVGIAKSPELRAEQHGRRSPWWRFVSRTTVEWHGGRRAAHEAEKNAIAVESPVFNKAHSRNREAALAYVFRAIDDA